MAQPSPPTLLLTRRYPDAVRARAREMYRVLDNDEDRQMSADELVGRAEAEAADAVITCATDDWSAGVIERLPDSVKAIATFAVGYDNIDLAAAKARGIAVSNTPDVLTEATADIALLCLLGAARRGYEAQQNVRRGEWRGWYPTQFLGLELSGAVLGIVGMGRIGQAVARRARGFGMSVHYHNRSRLPAAQEQGATYHESLDAMLPHCRFVSLNAPGGKDTAQLLNAETIARLPRGAVVVNTARGTLIDDDALIGALRSGQLFAAGLDVFAGEPQLDPRYRELPNVFLLPHIGSATIETRNAMGFTCLDNLDAFFAGRTPPNALT